MIIHIFLIDTKGLGTDLSNMIFGDRQNNCTYLPANNTFLNARIMPLRMLKSPTISHCKRVWVLNTCNCCFCVLWDKKDGLNFYRCPKVTREAMKSTSRGKLFQVNFSMYNLILHIYMYKSNLHDSVLSRVK